LERSEPLAQRTIDPEAAQEDAEQDQAGDAGQRRVAGPLPDRGGVWTTNRSASLVAIGPLAAGRIPAHLAGARRASLFCHSNQTGCSRRPPFQGRTRTSERIHALTTSVEPRNPRLG